MGREQAREGRASLLCLSHRCLGPHLPHFREKGRSATRLKGKSRTGERQSDSGGRRRRERKKEKKMSLGLRVFSARALTGAAADQFFVLSLVRIVVVHSPNPCLPPLRVQLMLRLASMTTAGPLGDIRQQACNYTLLALLLTLLARSLPRFFLQCCCSSCWHASRGMRRRVRVW